MIAMVGGWRMTEVTLISFIFIGGSISGWFAVLLCWHKGRKDAFLALGAIYVFTSLLWPLVYEANLLPVCYPVANGTHV